MTLPFKVFVVPKHSSTLSGGIVLCRQNKKVLHTEGFGILCKYKKNTSHIIDIRQASGKHLPSGHFASNRMKINGALPERK